VTEFSFLGELTL